MSLPNGDPRDEDDEEIYDEAPYEAPPVNYAIDPIVDDFGNYGLHGGYDLNFNYNPIQGNNVMSKFEAGDNVEVVGNATGMNQIGNCFTVARMNGAYVQVVENNWNFVIADLELRRSPKASIVKRTAEAKAIYDINKSKLDYLEETGKDAFDREDYTNHTMKKVLENANLSLEAKMERLKSLLKS